MVWRPLRPAQCVQTTTTANAQLAGSFKARAGSAIRGLRKDLLPCTVGYSFWKLRIIEPVRYEEPQVRAITINVVPTEVAWPPGRRAAAVLPQLYFHSCKATTEAVYAGGTPQGCT
eukprot:28179-Chlamydomonas_euryale.AAC.2